MKKGILLIFIILFSLILSQQISYSGKDESFKKLQTWLKGLDKTYTIKELKNLTYLDLSNKELKELPPEIGHLTKLEYLMLKDNELRSLLPEIGNLTNLLELFVNNNDLSSLPSEIGKLTKLEVLALSGNQFSNKEKEKVKKLLPKCDIFFEER